MSDYRTGRLIVLEGIDGSGTTTHAARLEKSILSQGMSVHLTQEPSNGPLGLLLRLALTRRLGGVGENGAFQPLDEASMALTFAADRADHLRYEIQPRLASGTHVVCDRYYLSSLAYQGPTTSFEWVWQLNARFVRPDITILLDIPFDVWERRMAGDRRTPQIYEQLERQKAVRAGYFQAIELLRAEGERIVVVNSDRPADEVHSDIARIVGELLVGAKA